ncbi:MAG: AAA family ATPase [Burkholderiales bacterium]|nr:AAA family ATPase [Burkholderiales bacterium]
MSALPQALLDPRSYPHPVASMRLVETHISWLLLTGSFAYKLKKPVKLDFLDFTSLEQRRHYCLEELRLNRRFAPRLYLDVVAITGSVHAPRVGGSGEPIDYAVKMREFAQEDLLDRCLARAALLPRHVDALADTCARLHANAAIAADDSDYGAAATLLPPALDNFRSIESLLSGNGVHLRIAALKRWTESQHGRLAPVFAARKQHGRIRECHGDLHLGNITLIDDEPTLFDCIEFNPAFRWIDVMNEMAFTVMDFAARGRADFGQRLLSRYLEASGDYAGLAVLPFYLVYRALVRAKVACIRARQSGQTAAQSTRDWQEFLHRIALAEGYAGPARPFLAITCGLSGSGKTYVSQSVLEATGAIRVRSDVERKRLCGLDACDDSSSALGEGIYSSETTERTFGHLAGLARTIVESGYPVIVDAAFIRRERRVPFQRLAETLGVPFAIIHCTAADEVLTARIEQRRAGGEDASEADLDVLRAQQAMAQPPDASEHAVTIAVDSADPASVRSLAERLAGLRTGSPP